jgi:hypothetical protein
MAAVDLQGAAAGVMGLMIEITNVTWDGNATARPRPGGRSASNVANGTSRTSGDVRLESAKWGKADIDHACCDVVSNGCCDVSALRGPAFRLSPAPLPPPKPAIACTSCAA